MAKNDFSSDIEFKEAATRFAELVGVETSKGKQTNNSWIEIINVKDMQRIDDSSFNVILPEERFGKVFPIVEDKIYAFLAPDLLCHGEWIINNVDIKSPQIVLTVCLNEKFNNPVSLAMFLSNSNISPELKSELSPLLQIDLEKTELEPSVLREEN